MKIKLVITLFFCWCLGFAHAQEIIGPVRGPVTFRTAAFWVAVQYQSASDNISIMHRPASMPNAALKPGLVTLTNEADQALAGYKIYKMQLVGLMPGQIYQYEIRQQPNPKNGSKGRLLYKGELTTQTLFQWRGAAPDFSFLAGSCAYFNEPSFDRPPPAYGLDSSIFETMAKEKAAFMLWLGDNWYTREVDYTSQWGLWYRALRDRSMPVLKNFWMSMPHLAIWDDHDFGPNDLGRSYVFKNTSRTVFENMWCNPSVGDGKDGIYTRYQYADVDFFMLDDRWWRDYEDLADTVNGQLNTQKHFLGTRQMDWLKSELRYSKANPFVSFRVVVIGSQVLNPASPHDKMANFQAEYNQLIKAIADEHIPGVIFLTGDRHHSEIIKVDQPNAYPLYDVTCSPLTSRAYKFSKEEENNAWRVFGFDQKQNYTRISVVGQPKERQMQFDFFDARGQSLGGYTIQQKELQFSKK